MNTLELLERLQKESLCFTVREMEERLQAARKNYAVSKDRNLQLGLGIYNYESLLELKNRTETDTVLTAVDTASLLSMEKAVDTYMRRYSRDEMYGRFIRIVSVYRTFLAGMPLHPPGMFDKNGVPVYKNGFFVCPIRSKEILKEDALCRFCVCIS